MLTLMMLKLRQQHRMADNIEREQEQNLTLETLPPSFFEF